MSKRVLLESLRHMLIPRAFLVHTPVAAFGVRARRRCMGRAPEVRLPLEWASDERRPGFLSRCGVDVACLSARGVVANIHNCYFLGRVPSGGLVLIWALYPTVVPTPCFALISSASQVWMSVEMQHAFRPLLKLTTILWLHVISLWFSCVLCTRRAGLSSSSATDVIVFVGGS